MLVVNLSCSKKLFLYYPPERIETFVDLFGGGFNVGINVNADKIIYNDIETHICQLLKYFYSTNTQKLLDEIHDTIERFDLTKDNSDGFLKLREYYNNTDNRPIIFYVLICYAFNYQIRFNKDGKYNMPFGKNRSSFNNVLEQKFIEFVEALHKKSCKFSNVSFNEFDFSILNQNDFVYCDPPYLNATATYNENGGWSFDNEEELLSILDSLNERKIRFALSNNLKYNNELLTAWKDKYNVNYINGDYSNCNYHKIDKSRDIEVLITNY